MLLVIAGCQLIRVDRTNPATVASHTIQAQARISNEFAVVLNRACNDCHSNSSVWPWYTEIAPLSWLMAYTVKQGRKQVNFSEWSAYSAQKQRSLLIASCRMSTA